MTDDNMLLDSFHESGTDFDRFAELVHHFDKITEVNAIMKPKDLSLIHCENIMNEQKEAGYKLFYLPSTISNAGFVEMVRSISTASISKKKLSEKIGSEALVDEISKTGLMILNNQKHVLISETALPLLTRHLDVTAAMTKPGTARDIFLASKISDHPEPLLFVTRKNSKGAKKIFGVFSDRYLRIPFNQLLTAIEIAKLKKTFYWEISNRKVEIYMGTGKKIEKDGVKYYPGIHFCTSDTGTVSFKCEACIKIVGKKGVQIVILSNESVCVKKESSEQEAVVEFEDMLSTAKKDIERFTKNIDVLANSYITNGTQSVQQQIINAAKANNLDKVVGLRHVKQAVKSLDSSEYCKTMLDLATTLSLLALPCNSYSTQRKLSIAKGNLFLK